MSTMVEHARRELGLLGEEPGFAACLTATVGAFASYGHSDGSHAVAVEMLMMLLRRRPLTPLTADPAEWIDRSEMNGTPLWQNERDSRAMSRDRGRTYTLVEDGGGQVSASGLYTSAVPPWWVRALREREQVSENQAVAAVGAYLEAGPIDATDRDALDRGDEQERTRYMKRRWGVAGADVAALLYEPRVFPDLVGVE